MMTNKRLSHGLNTDQTRTEPRMTRIARMPARPEVFSENAPAAAFFCPLFFCRSVLPAVPSCTWCAFVTVNPPDLAAKRRNVRNRRAVPKRSQTIPKRFPNRPNPLFNQFRLKRMPFSRELLRSATRAFCQSFGHERAQRTREGMPRDCCSATATVRQSRKCERAKTRNPLFAISFFRDFAIPL